MGENWILKTHDNFKRQMDAMLSVRGLQPELFDMCPPDNTVSFWAEIIKVGAGESTHLDVLLIALEAPVESTGVVFLTAEDAQLLLDSETFAEIEQSCTIVAGKTRLRFDRAPSGQVVKVHLKT